MNKARRFESLTHFELQLQPQLAVHQFASRTAPRAFELFNAAGANRWIAALRATSDESARAQQHHDAQLSTAAMQRAPAKKSH